MKTLCGILLWLAAVVPDERVGKVLGEVVAVEGHRVTLRTDDGRSVAVTADEATKYVKARPGAASLEGAPAIGSAALAAGDRILAAGRLSGDGASLAARQVVVMSRADIHSKQEQERMDWRRRGISGVITAVDAEAREITVRNRASGEAATIVVSTMEKKATLRRYAPDSVKFADAKASSFEEVQIGDQVRALGDRSEDGGRLRAEHVVTGAFRTVVGAVEAVDAAAGEVRLSVGPQEKVAVAVRADTTLRRLPADLAVQMTTRGGKTGPPNLGDLVDRMPALKLEELKPGDRLAISSTRGADASRVTAIILVAGIEPLLAAPDAGRRPGAAGLMPGLPSGALDMGMGGI